MTNPQEPATIDEIDSRQSEILDQLDDLNYRVEQLLQQHGASRKQDIEIVETYKFPTADNPTDET